MNLGAGFAAPGLLSRARRRAAETVAAVRCTAAHTAGVIAMAALLAVGLYATGKYIAARQQASAGEFYTGSILYMPDEGRTCHQRLFDNRTGRFSDNGPVDCVNAAYQGASGSPKLWSAARARVISSGFRER
jgi:hypothetical protein